MTPGGPGRGGAARRPRRGLRRHVRGALPGRLRRRRRGRPAERPTYATFADGHDEMLVNDAIAESARLGRWVDVVREPASTRRPAWRRDRHEARPADRAVPRDAARSRSSTGRPPTASRASRSPAGRGPPARPGATPARQPHRRRQPDGEQARPSCVDRIAASGLTISGLGYYPNPLHPDPEHRAAVIGHLKQVIVAAELMDVPFVNTFMGARRRRRTRTTTGTRRSGSGRTSSRFAAGPRAQDHHRELPDAVQPRRVAGRPQPRDHAADLAPHPRAVGRHRSGSTSTRRT